MAKLEFELPPKEIMSKLLDNIEAQLPREDHVKYDSRAKKLDWEKIRVDGYNPEQCKKLWYYVQDRYELIIVRNFREITIISMVTYIFCCFSSTEFEDFVLWPS